MAIWIDMTNSLSVWTGGLVGIVRAELEIAKNLHAVNKDVRFCRAMMEGYIEVSAQELEWLWDSKQTGDAYLERMGRKTKEVVPLSKDDIPAGLKEAYEYSEGRYDRIKKFFEMLISRTPFLLRFIPYLLFGFILLPLKAASMTRMAFIRSKGGKENAKEIVSDLKKHPFTDDCMLFSAGWFSSKGIIKEKLLSQIKNELPNFRIIYLVYDLVLINEATCALYEAKKVFEDYLYWISNNCDYVFFGGNTAKIDAEIQPFRYGTFPTYALIHYMTVIAPRLGYKTTEVPVLRQYPAKGKVPTKISPLKGNLDLMMILWNLFRKKYDPKE